MDKIKYARKSLDEEIYFQQFMNRGELPFAFLVTRKFLEDLKYECFDNKNYTADYIQEFSEYYDEMEKKYKGVNLILKEYENKVDQKSPMFWVVKYSNKGLPICEE